MDLLTTPDEMQAWSRRRQAAGSRVGVVPTMGALHGGHMALVDAVRERADAVVVTIFVNPLQFNQASDFDAYPRPIDDDLMICGANGVDAVYAPTARAMYAPDFETHVEPGDLAARLEGPMRPGHFRGVTTVVTKLFGATIANVAAFGQKDFQQLSIIQRMVRDLDMPVEIVAAPIVRDPDGLAMSSRNVRLTPPDRAAAVVLSQALFAAADMCRSGERDATRLRSSAIAHIEAEPRATLEYVDVVDAASLEEIEVVEGEARILTAAWFGDVRLIDNVALEPGS